MYYTPTTSTTSTTNLRFPLNITWNSTSTSSTSDSDFYRRAFERYYASAIEDIIATLKKETAEITEKEFMDLLEGDG